MDTLTKAMEVEAKKMRREVAAMEKEVAAMKVGPVKGPVSSSQLLPGRYGAPWKTGSTSENPFSLKSRFMIKTQVRLKGSLLLTLLSSLSTFRMVSRSGLTRNNQ